MRMATILNVSGISKDKFVKYTKDEPTKFIEIGAKLGSRLPKKTQCHFVTISIDVNN
jgi:hypothetical protein